MTPPRASTASHHPNADHTNDGDETQSQTGAMPPGDPPAMLGPYRIVKELGRGGMGAVYLADDPALKRQVALKVMAPALAVRPDAKARFLREAQAMAAVKHDHIVTVYHVGEAAGTAYVAMELLDGVPLNKWLAKNPTPKVGNAVRIAKEVCRGLAAAHAKGLVHRDVKPGNVWLEAPRGRVKLLDFGLARLAADDQHITNSDTVVGTPAYMSPEQARALPVDGRTDLWSVGVLLYRMLAGRLPFEAPTTMALLTALALDNPPHLCDVAPAVPPALADLVMRLLQKDPASRPPTAAAVANELQVIERTLVAGPTPATVPAVPPKRSRRKWIVAGATAFAGLAVLGGVIVTIASTGGPKPVIDIGDSKDKQGEVPSKSPVITTPQAADEPKAVERVVAGSPFPPLDAGWWDRAQKLPAEEQGRAVADELRRRNPDLGKAADDLNWRVERGQVAVLRVRGVGLIDLTPVRALPSLRSLICNTAVVGPLPMGSLNDLTPLTGLPLPELQLRGNPVSDLKPLAGMPLQRLDIEYTRVNDITPLAGLPLTHLTYPTGVQDLTPLRRLPLEDLSGTGMTLVNNLVTLRDIASIRTLNGAPAGPKLAFAEALSAAPVVAATATLKMGNCLQVAYSPDGRTLAATATDAQTVLWDVDNQIMRHRLPEVAHAAAWTSSGRTVLTTSSGTMTLLHWDAATGLQTDDKQLAFWGRQVAIAPDGGMVAVGLGRHGTDDPSAVARFRQPGFVPLPPIPTLGTGEVYRIVYSPDGKRLAVTGPKQVLMYDAESGRLVRKFPAGGKPRALAYTPDGKRMAVGYECGITVFDPADGREVVKTPDLVATAALAFAPGNRLLMASERGQVYALDAETLRPLACYQGHNARNRSIDVAPDGKTFATASSDGTIKLWPLDPPATGAGSSRSPAP